MLDESQLKELCRQTRELEDKKHVLAEQGSFYDARLARLTVNLASLDGKPLSYKVYILDEENAYAMPDGSVRVFSGLMDIMNDDELRFVLAHEVGHLALGHSKEHLQVAYATKAVRNVAGSITTVSQISDSLLGDIAESFLSSQFSQIQEDAADEYSVTWMKKNGYDTQAAVSAMKKLGEGGGGVFSSHPSGAHRIKNIEQAASK